MRASRTGRQARWRGTAPGGVQAPCAKRGCPPAGEEHRKYPGWAKGDAAGAKRLAPKLFARGLWSGANVSCCHALEGNGDVKSRLLARPVERVTLFGIPAVGQRVGSCSGAAEAQEEPFFLGHQVSVW